jgi:hypothetical protein
MQMTGHMAWFQGLIRGNIPRPGGSRAVLALALLRHKSTAGGRINKGKFSSGKRVAVGTISISCRRHSGVDGGGFGSDFTVTDMQEGWFCKVGEVCVTCINF